MGVFRKALEDSCSILIAQRQVRIIRSHLSTSCKKQNGNNSVETKSHHQRVCLTRQQFVTLEKTSLDEIHLLLQQTELANTRTVCVIWSAEPPTTSERVCSGSKSSGSFK